MFKKTRDKIEIRGQALKLRYWPMKQAEDAAGKVVDLDWTWVIALRGLKIGELRIDDVIGGNNNLRIIFYQADVIPNEVLPIMWILRVMQKKQNGFSKHDLSIMKVRRTLVRERFYNNPAA